MDGAFPAPIEEIEQRLGVPWHAIHKAWEDAARKAASLTEAIQGIPSSDMSFVVFGSLARGEWTVGSDVDWTLLIDGVVDPRHKDVEREVQRKLDELEQSTGGRDRRPGREGTFGEIAFSHQLVHQIGGEHDTNRNVTRRILLLSESMPIGGDEAYTRVLGAVIDRYVREDRGFIFGAAEHRIPRFLLNDIVRYWRTVTVDFAYKQNTRGAKGMPLRNIKLRLSRKLVFAAGLLRCFSCTEDSIQRALRKGPEEGVAAVANHLWAECRRSALEVVANAVAQFDVPDEVANDLFSAYDQFLELLDDDDRRERLKNLADFDDSDPVFAEGRVIGRRFDEALRKMFFEGRDDAGSLVALTRRYGVF